MKIALLRHGKPVSLRQNKVSASALYVWINKYNSSALSKSSLPTNEALECAKECNAIVCSALSRSIDSAKALNAKKVVLSDSLFNEAGLPYANWRILKLSPKLWTVIFRIFWLLGYSRQSESFKEAKVRAIKAVNKLIELAQEHQSILFVGNGVYNRILAKELKRSGWLGPDNPGSKYWSFGIYKQ